MMKKKTFDIADSNVALLGSKMDKNTKIASAQTEPAWKNAGKKEGMQIWRIEQFKVVAWPQNQYGKFHSGDSYIILKTYKDPANPIKLKFDLHFWLGASTSQDEAGTAAYKTVELDTLLGDAPVQHREVEAHESTMFCSYFKDQGGIVILEGGTESGFNHVKPEEYKPRLMHLKGRKNVRVVEVPLSAASLNKGDVFVLDNGFTIYQWQGSGASMNEKMRAAQFSRALDDDRKGKPSVEVIDQATDADATEFWELLGGRVDVTSEGEGDEKWEKADDKVLFQLTDAGGKMEFNRVGEGARVTRDKLDSKDVFILDLGAELWVWIGSGASREEKKRAMYYASKYLEDSGKPSYLPITRILEGGENDLFESFFAGGAAITKKAPASAPRGTQMETGSGCYLTYDAASNGTLFTNWKHEAVEGALAYFKPSKSVPGFKFKSKGGREELTRNTDSAPKNYYQGWCNYLKSANEFKSEVYVMTNDVQVCIQESALTTIETGAAFTLHTFDKPAVAVFPKSNQIFEGTSKIGRDHFINKAQGVGAALVLPVAK